MPLLRIAWSACPDDVSLAESCLNNTDWRSQTPFNTTMTISMRRASTVFHRFNFTIIDIIDLSPPSPTDYIPEDFFGFYDVLFAVDQNQSNWFATIQYQFLISVASPLGNDVDTQVATGSNDRLSKLQEFLAVPIVVFNNAVYEGGPTFDMGKSVTLAVPSYRVLQFAVSTYLS